MLKRLLFLAGSALGIFALSFFLGFFQIVSPFHQVNQAVDWVGSNGLFQPSEKTAYFHGQTFLLNGQPSDSNPEITEILGENDNDKKIIVDLSKQTLYAYENNQLVYEFLISSGKWGRTPTGVFQIWIKLRYTLMHGGSRALNTYYYLPNVPYTMFFANSEVSPSRGYSLHGTYWHDNFGHPMSHGCINMRTEDVEKLYYWARPVLGENQQSVSATKDNPGTLIYIFGEAPWE